MVMAMEMKKSIKRPLLTAISSYLVLSAYSPIAFAQSIPILPNLSGANPANASSDTALLPDDGNGSTPVWRISPRITIIETYTDNSNVSSGANGKQSDLISRISPGIRIEGQSARLKGYFDYSLSALYYANSGSSNTQNALNTFGTLEALENWLFVDASGTIAQQSVSAFGTQSPSNSTINNNTSETSTYRLSPYIRGQLAGQVEYSLRYALSTTSSNSSAASSVDISQWSGQLRGSTPFQSLKWSLDGNQQSVDYSNGRQTDAMQLRALGTYAIVPQLTISLSTGWESNNYLSIEQDRRTTRGYGFDWRPTERTEISAFREKRFFGNGHNYKFSHRFPLSSIQYTDTKNINILPDQFGRVGIGTYYDIFSLFCRQQLASSITDPAALAIAVNSCANAFLISTGVPANAQATTGFLSSQAYVQRMQQLSWALFGARNSITLLANRSENQSTLGMSSALDDFSKSNVIRQRGLSLNISHRLSELSSLNFMVSRHQSSGTNNTLKTTTNLYQATLSTRLGTHTTGSLSVRRAEFDSTTNPYNEHALIATLSYIY